MSELTLSGTAVRVLGASAPTALAKAELSAEAVIARMASGDRLALNDLYDRFGKMAYGLALRVARDPALAEDAVQDAFLSAWRSAGNFDAGRGTARAWIATLTFRRAVDVVNRSARRREDLMDVVPEQAVSSAAERAAERAQGREIRRAIAALPLAQQEALELAFYGGYSQTEIARQLAVPLGTVKSRIFSALADLRARLAADG